MTSSLLVSAAAARLRARDLVSPKAGLLLASALLLGSVSATRGATASLVDDVAAFTDKYCSSCHNDVDKEAGLDLTSLKYSPADAENFALWVKVHDRVQNGEMP